MAFRALRRTVAEIDQRHRATVAPTGDDLDEQGGGSDLAPSRRGFLTRAAAGGALAVGATALPVSSFVPGAMAQTDGTETDGTTPGTAPPPVVSGDPSLVEGNDITLVVFLQSVELAVIETYGDMVATGKLAPAIAQTAREFTLHHIEHEKALAELAGGASTTAANPRLIAELTPLVAAAADQEQLIDIAYDLEERVTATYAAALGALVSWRAAAVASKILPVDSQHALVWSQVLVPDIDAWATRITEWIPNFQSATGAIDIIGYPVS